MPGFRALAGVELFHTPRGRGVGVEAYRVKKYRFIC